MVTILDVIDSFFSMQEDRNLLTVPGRTLYDFGEEVRRFAESYSPPSTRPEEHPVYLGGWPSANFWHAHDSRLVLSTLLYAGQVLVKDPVSDWFSVEQYQMPKYLSARPGYIDPHKNIVNTAGTRQFLSLVVPQLQRLRPLIEKGIIVLIPSKAYLFSRQKQVGSISDEVVDRICADLDSITDNFGPNDLVVDDNRRGLFVFAHGDREQQIRKAVRDSVAYFISEYGLSSENGFHYAALFPYEAYLCETGLGQVFKDLPGSKVLRAVLNSRCALYSGLTPEIVAEIRDDDSFGHFRASLVDIYDGIPATQDETYLADYLSELEAARLAPILENIKREARTGVLSKIGIGLLPFALRIAVGIMTGQMLSPGAEPETLAVATGAPELVELISKKSRDRRRDALVVWEKLYEHAQHYSTQFRHYSYKKATGDGSNAWAFPEKPGMTLSVTEGSYIADWLFDSTSAAAGEGFPPSNVYALCPCGSGRKFKFCCKGLEGIRL